MMWITAVLGVVAALVYANRLRRTSFAEDPLCTLAQMAGGIGGCLLALAAMHGADLAPVVVAMTLLYGHIAATGVPLRHGQQPPQRI